MPGETRLDIQRGLASMRGVRSRGGLGHNFAPERRMGYNAAAQPLSGAHQMQLLERERCLADLAGVAHAAADRGGCIALVAGEAGIGKTMLVQEFSKLRL